ncbi:MAG: prephenate dehydrogenase, partial [bacterium]
EHARPDLFVGRPWLLTSPPTDQGGPALDSLSAFVRALGAEPRVMQADAHDRLLAYLSHLPQLTASALMQVVGDAVGQDGLGLAGRGLADTTRLASSPDDIWKDIAATNADQIGPALDALIEVLQALRNDLPEGDRLAEVFTDARRWRERLKKPSA